MPIITNIYKYEPWKETFYAFFKSIFAPTNINFLLNASPLLQQNKPWAKISCRNANKTFLLQTVATTHTHVDNKRPLQMSKSKQLTLTNSSGIQGYMTF